MNLKVERPSDNSIDSEEKLGDLNYDSALEMHLTPGPPPMIFDRLDNAALYESMHPLFARAFEFLRTKSATLPDGKYELDGDKLYVLIATAPGRSRAGAKLEAHQKYIDIQYVIRGVDDIGLKPTAACTDVELEYTPEKDVALFLDKPTNWVNVPAGSFTIFYPDDGHAPLGSSAETLKAVVKVAVK